MEYVQLDLQKGENITAQMRAKNPLGKVPVLELDDGTCIGESVASQWRYVDISKSFSLNLL